MPRGPSPSQDVLHLQDLLHLLLLMPRLVRSWRPESSPTYLLFFLRTIHITITTSQLTDNGKSANPWSRTHNLALPEFGARLQDLKMDAMACAACAGAAYCITTGRDLLPLRISDVQSGLLQLPPAFLRNVVAYLEQVDMLRKILGLPDDQLRDYVKEIQGGHVHLISFAGGGAVSCIRCLSGLEAS